MTENNLKARKWQLVKYLWKINEQRITIRQKIDFYYTLIKDFSSYKSPINDVTGIHSNRLSDSTFQGVIDLERYSNEIRELQKQLSDNIKIYDSYMDCLNEREVKVMNYRYLESLAWEVIAQEMNYSKRQAIRIHDKSILKILKDGTQCHF